jgi:uncharacterized protein YndB with AHSA1/START domain
MCKALFALNSGPNVVEERWPGVDEVSITRSVDLEAPAEDVWRALTDPDLLRDWLAADVDLDVRPGGGGTIAEPDGLVRRALVDEVVPARRLSMHWWPEDGSGPATAVRLDLEPIDGGTRLVVTETLLAPVPGRAAPVASAMDARWGVRFLLLGCRLLVPTAACCR